MCRKSVKSGAQDQSLYQECCNAMFIFPRLHRNVSLHICMWVLVPVRASDCACQCRCMPVQVSASACACQCRWVPVTAPPATWCPSSAWCKCHAHDTPAQHDASVMHMIRHAYTLWRKFRLVLNTHSSTTVTWVWGFNKVRAAGGSLVLNTLIFYD